MKRIVVCVCVLLMAVAAGCKKGGEAKKSAGPEAGSIVATVGTESITLETLKDAAKGQLRQIEMKVYEVEKAILNELINDKLIEQAAKKESLAEQDYLKKMVFDKVIEPKEEEIKAVYDSRAGNAARPYEEMKPEIAAYLKATQEKKLALELLASLKEQFGVKTYLNVPRVDVDIKEYPVMGPEIAPVTLVEFSDYQCPFSGKVRDTVWGVLEQYKDKIKYVYRDFPLSFHREAQGAHEAAHCAGEQGKYFEYNKVVFENQKKLAPEDLKKYAETAGLDMVKFDQCVKEAKYAAKVQKSVEDGVSSGVTGTPTFFINGILISGAQPPEVFKEIIDNEIATKK